MSLFWKAVLIPKARGKTVPKEKTSNDVLKLRAGRVRPCARARATVRGVGGARAMWT